MLVLILIIGILSACNQSESEDVGLYEEKFQDQSKNWEVTLDLKELSETWKPSDDTPYEEINLMIKYLEEIEEDLEFHYVIQYGNPIRATSEPGDKLTLSADQLEYTETQFQQRMIEEVCFGRLTIEISWEDPEGESQEDRFVFQDKQNPQCEHVVLMAPRGDVN